MARVLISLLGGRPVPNILAVLHLKPDYLYIIVSEDSLQPGGSYEKAISALPDKLRPSQPLSVKPYVLKDTIECCRRIASEHSGDEIIVNSASEPKTMAFGAYDFAKTLKESGQNIDICYLSREGFIWAFRDDNTVESAKISLMEYFTSYGWNVDLKTKVSDSKFTELVSLLIENLPTSHSLLHVLRSSNRGTGKRTIKCKKLTEDQVSVLRKIENLQVVDDVKESEGTVSFTFKSDEDAQLILTGDFN